MGTNQTIEISPQRYARIGGVLYLVIIAIDIFSELFVRGKLIVPGNATATASNIVAHELLWRTSIAVDFLMHVCDVPLMMILYVLLKPVNKNLALLALLFNVVQTAVLVANKMNLLTVLFVSGGAGGLTAFDPQQLHALAYLANHLHGYGFGVGLIFFGFECLVTGYLLFNSGYMPKALGVLMAIAGVCYLTNSFAMLIAPAFANALGAAILAPCFIAELSLCLWMLFKGVNLPVWRARTGVGEQ